MIAEFISFARICIVIVNPVRIVYTFNEWLLIFTGS